MHSDIGRQIPRSATEMPGKRIAIAIFVLAYALIIALLAAPRGYVVTDPGPVSGGLAAPAESASGAS